MTDKIIPYNPISGRNKPDDHWRTLPGNKPIRMDVSPLCRTISHCEIPWNVRSFHASVTHVHRRVCCARMRAPPKNRVTSTRRYGQSNRSIIYTQRDSPRLIVGYQWVSLNLFDGDSKRLRDSLQSWGVSLLNKSKRIKQKIRHYDIYLNCFFLHCCFLGRILKNRIHNISNLCLCYEFKEYNSLSKSKGIRYITTKLFRAYHLRG